MTESPACANCGGGPVVKFCAACGEKKLSHHDYALSHFIEHVVHDLTHFDAKIFSSLFPLFFKPGVLTAEYFAGHRTRYIKPITLFVLLNLFFFFTKGGLMNWTADNYIRSSGASAVRMVEERAAAKGKTVDEYKKSFTDAAKNTQKSMFFFAIPALALVLLLAGLWRRYYVEHLIYSIHFHAFYLVFMSIGLRILLFFLQPLSTIHDYFNRDPGIVYFIGFFLLIYHFVALPRVYGISRLAALPLAALLTYAEFVIILYVYQPLVFFWTLYTL